MSNIPLSRSISRAVPRSSRASSSSAGPSRTSPSPKKTTPNGRTLPASTLRSLISLHHSSAGFLHSPSELSIGFENAFRHTRELPSFRGYYDFLSSTTFNQSLHPPGGMENLVEKPNSTEARGMDLRGRTVMPASSVQRTFKDDRAWWSEKTTGRREQFLSERELRVQEALYGTWERGGTGMINVQPGLEGVLDYIEAKGLTVEEFAQQWEKRDELESVGKAKETEDGA